MKCGDVIIFNKTAIDRNLKQISISLHKQRRNTNVSEQNCVDTQQRKKELCLR